jgi:hypothetical protein
MSTEIILENEHARLVFHTSSKIIHHKLLKFTEGEHFRNLLLTGTATLVKHGARKWLSDDRLQTALPQTDINWADTIWFPKTAEAGWKFWALVLPENVIGQMNLKRILRINGDRGVTTQTFTDPDEALRWLEGC